MLKKIFLVPCLLIAGFIHGQTVDSLLKQAGKLASDKNYKEALGIYNKVWEKDSLNFDLYLERGTVYYELREVENAFNDYTKAIKLRPASAEPYHRRAILMMAIMYTEEAIMDNTKAINLATNDTMRMICFMNRGNAKQQKRDFQGAFEDYSRAYLYDTSDMTILNNMATVLDELGRVDECLQYLQKVIQRDPTFVGAYVNVGFQYTKLQRYKEAIVYFDKALSLQKDEPLTLNNRGLARYHLKDYTGALEDINKSLALYPDNSYAFKNRALVHLAQKQKEKACADLQKAIDLEFTKMYGSEVEELLKANCK
ncbi:MAG TPA: tetratricopeptide repeat protein [Chitinophagaceae bacterium]